MPLIRDIDIVISLRCGAFGNSSVNDKIRKPFQVGGKSCPRRLQENAARPIRKRINNKKIVESEVQVGRLNAKLTVDKPAEHS